MCYYFDDIIKFQDTDLDILIDGNTHKNILNCNISYKTFIGSKHLHIRFNKIDGFIRVFDGNRYLVLFGGEKYDFICNRIRYLIGVKSDTKYVFLIIMQKLKLIFDSSLLEKSLTLHNVIILIKLIKTKATTTIIYS